MNIVAKRLKDALVQYPGVQQGIRILLAMAAEEIDRLEGENERLRTPARPPPTPDPSEMPDLPNILKRRA